MQYTHQDSIHKDMIDYKTSDMTNHAVNEIKDRSMARTVIKTLQLFYTREYLYKTHTKLAIEDNKAPL